jgi:uncharacterized membrane protein
MLKCLNIYMKKNIFLGIFFFLLLLALPALAQSNSEVNKELLKGEIIEIPETNIETIVTQEKETTSITIQTVKIKIDQGSLKGETINVENDYAPLEVGQKVFLIYEKDETGEHFSYPHPVRINGLIWLILLFFVIVVIFAKWQGLRSIITIALSFIVIAFFVVPQISQGKDPVKIAFYASFFIITVGLYFVYGWRRKTHAAFLGTSTTLILTYFLSKFFVNLIQLTGQASEEAVHLKILKGDLIDLQGLLLAGIIIGVIGALNDVAVDQSSTVFALKKANPKFSFKKLYQEALSVGKDHLLSTITTLVLAYVGVALPLLLIVSNFEDLPLIFIFNNEIFATEIARMVLGSLGLLLVTPLVNLFASLMAHYRKTTPRKSVSNLK